MSITKFCGLSWWLSGKEYTCQCRRWGFDSWVGKIPWRRKWQPAPVFLLRKSHEQRSLVGCSLWGCKRVGHELATKQTTSWMLHFLLNSVPLAAFPISDNGHPIFEVSLAKTLRVTPDVFQLLLHKIYKESLLVQRLKYITIPTSSYFLHPCYPYLINH